ncbi:MAG: choice-of-anchor tandem repeat GloVer-containing protein [Candidatus Cybelea sp.]
MRTCCSFCFALILTLGLAACAWQGVAPPSQNVAGALARPAAARGYKLIYSFPGGAGGANPDAGPTFVNGVGFGTTGKGGDVGCNCGTVFAGTKVIYDFKGASSKDGATPIGALLPVGDKLYGITGAGGRDGGACAARGSGVAGCGTVYEIDTTGNERVIYRFKGGSDGETPGGGLIYRKGVLYGTTFSGGTNKVCYSGNLPPGCGVVFAVDLSGHEKVIYRFKGGSDGEFPNTKLLSLNGTLYGTTVNGGGGNPRFCYAGCGTIFSVTPAGKKSLIYTFKGGKDGMAPYSPLLAVNGFLYGTTAEGGCMRVCDRYGSVPGGGTIFKMSSSGSETIIHRFVIAKASGLDPVGPLVFLNGHIFGVTAEALSPYAGTIYSATLKSFKQLYGFRVTLGDAQDPAGLTLKPSTQELYGVGHVGGANGVGAIFRYTL